MRAAYARLSTLTVRSARPRSLAFMDATRRSGASCRLGPPTQAPAAIRSSDAIELLDNVKSTAARFSRRCSTDDVPGISRMLGARCSSHASATCIGVAPSSFATSDSAVDCSGVKPPTGKNGP